MNMCLSLYCEALNQSLQLSRRTSSETVVSCKKTKLHGLNSKIMCKIMFILLQGNRMFISFSLDKYRCLRLFS